MDSMNLGDGETEAGATWQTCPLPKAETQSLGGTGDVTSLTRTPCQLACPRRTLWQGLTVAVP